MELRSFNVQRIYNKVVICRLGNKIGVKREILKEYEDDIKDMVSQLKVQNDNGSIAYLCSCNERKDGEYWTSTSQIIEMLLLLGERVDMCNVVFWDEYDRNRTVVRFLAKNESGDEQRYYHINRTYNNRIIN